MGGLCSFPVDCLAWGLPALEPTSCRVGPGLGANVPSKMSAFRWVFPDMFATSFYVQIENQSHPPTFPGDPPRPAVRSGPGSYEVTAFSLGPAAHEALCAPSKSGVSTFPSPWSSCDQAPLAFKAKCSAGSSSWCQTPRLGSLTWGSELSLLWGTSAI